MIERLDERQLMAKPLRLPEVGGQRPSYHVFERDSIFAVNAALACQRPLLVRGEPGAGKSQLARAIALALERVYISTFVDAHTQAFDLLWSHDAVTRLADAQTFKPSATHKSSDQLARQRYVLPGPLWWAFDWKGATKHVKQAKVKVKPPRFATPCHPKNGLVVLIDEIDKADSSVPNGLLECLGQSTFSVPAVEAPVSITGPHPLVILTTNEDRALPDAFVRRCVVLHLRLPDPEVWPHLQRDQLVRWLVDRGKAHFEDLETSLLERAAKQVVKDRSAVREAGFCAPGLAEYIDLLTVLVDGGVDGAEDRIEQLAPFVLRKHEDPGPGRGE